MFGTIVLGCCHTAMRAELLQSADRSATTVAHGIHALVAQSALVALSALPALFAPRVITITCDPGRFPSRAHGPYCPRLDRLQASPLSYVT